MVPALSAEPCKAVILRDHRDINRATDSFWVKVEYALESSQVNQTFSQCSHCLKIVGFKGFFPLTLILLLVTLKSTVDLFFQVFVLYLHELPFRHEVLVVHSNVNFLNGVFIVFWLQIHIWSAFCYIVISY